MHLTLGEANDLIRHTLILALFVSAPMLVIGLVVGIMVSLFQAITQIQEQTLSFIPKTAAMVTAAIVLMPWITHRLVEYAIRMLGGGTMTLLEWIPTYVLVFFRVAGMFIYAPLFGSAQIPKRVRVLLAAIIAMGLASTITKPAMLPDSLWMLTEGIVGEIVFGLAMGMIASFIFIAVQWAGEIIGQQMGLNISEVFDPQFGGQGSIIGNLYFMFTLVVFLLIDGHHAMLIGVRESLIQLPLLSVGMSSNLFTLIVAMFHASTILAFQLAAPILVTMLIVDLCMGFVSKTVPQLNLMSAGLSVRGLVGFLVLIMGMGMSCDVIRHAMLNTMDTVMMAYRTHW